MDAIQIPLSQSILNEDISAIQNALTSSIVSNRGENFSVEYWGQREYIKKKADSIQAYWKGIFYVKSNQTSIIFDPKYDFSLNKTIRNSFFLTYNSTRLNQFKTNIDIDSSIDYSTSSDLFYLPCYGLVSADVVPLIFDILTRVWNETYYSPSVDSSIWSTLKIETFNDLIIPYVNLKGSYSVLPYIVRAFSDNRLLNPKLYKEPLFERLKLALSGICELNDNIQQMKREDSLNFIQVVGTTSLDQSQLYLPSITNTHLSYFSSLSTNVKLSKPGEVISAVNLLVNTVVVTRIYYQMYANTTQPFDAYNYQIKYTRFKIDLIDANLANIMMRQANPRFGRIDLFTRFMIQNISLVIEWLPTFSIELARGKEISYDQKLGLEIALSNHWNNSKFKTVFFLLLFQKVKFFVFYFKLWLKTKKPCELSKFRSHFQKDTTILKQILTLFVYIT